MSTAAGICVTLVGLLLGCASAAYNYSEVNDSPLCEALNYCYRGSIHYALKEQGYKFHERTEIIDEARDMDRRCSCHPSCIYFGTCCWDASQDSRKGVEVNSQSFSRCLGLVGGRGVRIIDACPVGTNATLQKLCEATDRLKRRARNYPIKVHADTLPYVTSAETELTYKNVHCALCSKEKRESLVEWSLERALRCKPSPTTTCKVLQTPPPSGIKHGDHFLSPSFYLESVYLFTQHEDMTVCDINLIRECPGNTTQELSNKCSSTTTSIVQDTMTLKLYANVHCAECNEVAMLTSCERMRLPGNTEELDTGSSSTTSVATDEMVTGTSTSSTSTTSTTSAPLQDNGNNLNTGGFQSGTSILVGGNSRGEVISNSSSSESNDANSWNNGEWFPHGTVLIAGGDNPRGIVNGTASVEGTDDPRGIIREDEESHDIANRTASAESSDDSHNLIAGDDDDDFANGTIVVVRQEEPRGIIVTPTHNGTTAGNITTSPPEGSESVEEEAENEEMSTDSAKRLRNRLMRSRAAA